MRKFGWLVVAIALYFSNSFAQTYVPPNTTVANFNAVKAGAFTADGTLFAISHGKKPTIIVNKVGAGTGSVDFSGCVPYPGAPTVGVAEADFADATGDFSAQMGYLCYAYEFTMSTCSSCNFEIYVLEEK